MLGAVASFAQDIGSNISEVSRLKSLFAGGAAEASRIEKFCQHEFGEPVSNNQRQKGQKPAQDRYL
jgi:hypothetical protein